jgi:hypothetical protein
MVALLPLGQGRPAPGAARSVRAALRCRNPPGPFVVRLEVSFEPETRRDRPCRST